MKKRNSPYTGILLTVAACLLPMSVLAQQELGSSGNWTETTINDNKSVDIDGDISLEGTITIGDGNGSPASLTINNVADKEVTITRTTNNVMFRLHHGSKLTIKGKDGKMIVIDGGSEMKWTATEEEWEAHKKKSWKDLEYKEYEYTYQPLIGRDDFSTNMIETNGELVLENVRVEDYNGGNEQHNHAIHVAKISTDPCGKTTLKNCTITRCRSDRGSAIFVDKQTNEKNNKETCAVTLENVTIERCMVNPKHWTDDASWGGVIRFSGGSEGNLTMKNCTMKQNYSTGDGSCLWWNAGGSKASVPELTLIGCRFINNRSDRDAGAVRLESGFSFKEQETVFENNSCGRYGGAVQVADYHQTGGDNQVSEYNFDLNENLYVENNYAGEAGGGIAFYYIGNELPDESTFNIHLNGLNVTKNEAGIRGGGIIFTDLRQEVLKKYTFNVLMDRGYIAENKAGKGGGGIFARKFIIRNSFSTSRLITSANIEITGNEVTAADAIEKGGTGGGGGIAVYEGTMHLNSCNISNNRVTALNNEKTMERGYGGGILINRSEFTLDGNDNNISGNEANVGGGVAVLNTTENTKNIKFVSGIINGNTAHIAGGGASIVGNTKVTISGVNITDNTAADGGGLYVRGTTYVAPGTATVTYTGGDIKRNKAIFKDGEAQTPLEGETGWHKEVTDISGMGGGLCVNGRSTLEILVESSENLGIQGNTAVNGGDDVFCNGDNNTIVVLPNVASMATVEDGDRLFWVEDYITNDKDYKQGTAVNTSWKNDNIRFRDAQENNRMSEVFRLSQKADYPFNSQYGDDPDKIYQEFKNTYMCLTLGSVFTNIILQKSGMTERDNAIFKIYRWELSKGETVPEDLKTNKDYLYMTMILTDRDKAGDLRRKRIQADYGYYYYVEETTNWSWAYDSTVVPENKLRKIDKDAASDPEKRTFTFTNTPKDDTPRHAESVKVNEMPGK